MSLTTKVAVPAGINPGVSSAKQATMLSLLGNPRSSYGENCQAVTNSKLAPLIGTADVGPFRVTALKPALASLTAIFAEVKAQNRPLYDALGTAGALCVRLVRGSAHAISNHSWGTAIDLTIGGVLDARGDGKVQQGLVEIAPFFNRHGWYWGAAFRTEDGMHFEAGDALIRQWAGAGSLGGPKPQVPDLLSLGDRGPEVRRLQEALNTKTGGDLAVDGVFGPGTYAAVMAFQASEGLSPDGTVGAQTRVRLGL